MALSPSLKNLSPSPSWRGPECRNASRPTRRGTVPNSPTRCLTRLCRTIKKRSATRASWGALMYDVKVVRCDLMYAVCQLDRPTAKPSKIHMVAAGHTLCYLVRTTAFSITYKRGGFKLAVVSYSNRAHDLDNGMSTLCYLSMLTGAAIGFKSGLQGLTTMSTMKAELVKSDLAIKEQCSALTC